MLPFSVKTDHAPEAIGPYSQAMVFPPFVFTSGSLGNHRGHESEDVVGTIKEQTRQLLLNLNAILEEADSDLDRVVKTTVYLTNLDDFGDMNTVYMEFFPGMHKPARSTVEVRRLPRGAIVEIEAIAVIKRWVGA